MRGALAMDRRFPVGPVYGREDSKKRTGGKQAGAPWVTISGAHRACSGPPRRSGGRAGRQGGPGNRAASRAWKGVAKIRRLGGGGVSPMSRLAILEQPARPPVPLLQTADSETRLV